MIGPTMPLSYPLAKRAVLAVSKLRVTFARDSTIAVDGLDLTLHEGEVLAVVGETGSGKTMTAMSILGLTKYLGGQITSGTIEQGDRDLLQLAERDMRRVRGGEIAIVFQDPMAAMNPVQRVGVQIVEQLRVHCRISKRRARARAVELLELVGIPNASERVKWLPHQFSGGMLQRAAIAMALSCEPRVIVADEPTTGLDATVRGEILRLLAQLVAEKQVSILLITHDMGVVATIADRIAVMYGGRAVEVGDAVSVLGSAKHPYTKGLIAAVPGVDDTALPAAIPGEPGVVPTGRRGCLFALRCPEYEAGPCDASQALLGVSPTQRVACWKAVAPAANTAAPAPSGTGSGHVGT